MGMTDILNGVIYVLIFGVFVGTCILIYEVANKKKGTDKKNQYLSAGDEMRELNKQTDLTNRPMFDDNNRQFRDHRSGTDGGQSDNSRQFRDHQPGNDGDNPNTDVPVAHDHIQSDYDIPENNGRDDTDYDDLHKPNDFYKPADKYPSKKEQQTIRREQWRLEQKLKRELRQAQKDAKKRDGGHHGGGGGGHHGGGGGGNHGGGGGGNHGGGGGGHHGGGGGGNHPYRPDGPHHHHRTPTGERCLKCFNDHVKGATTKDRCSCNSEGRCNTCAMTDGSCKWCISGGEGSCIPSNKRCHHKPPPKPNPMQSNKNYKKCMQCVESQKCGTFSADSDKFVCGGLKRNSKGKIVETNGCNGRFNRKEAIENCRYEFKPHKSPSGIIIN